MIEGVPLPEQGPLQKGVLYRLPRLPHRRKREPNPETLEIVRRVEEAKIREYLEKRKRES